MKVVLAVTALFVTSAVMAQGTHAATESALSGLPMTVAKRLASASVPATANADSEVSGLPLSRAKRQVEPTPIAPTASGGDAKAQLSGIPLVLAKRP